MAYNPFGIEDDDPIYQEELAKLQAAYKPKPKETGGFWAGVKTAGGSQLQGVGQLAADFGWENNPIEAYGKQVQENNQLQTQSLGDIVENPWQALKEGTGMAVGYLAPGLVGRGLQVAGGAAKLAGLSRAGNALNAGVTQGALAALPSYGGIREEQGDTDSWTDKAVAGLGAAAVGAIENQFGAQRLLGIGQGAKAAAVPTKAEFVAKLGATPLKSGLKEFGRVVGAEMGEELAQNPIEQMSAYQNPLTPENIHESFFGAAMAGLGTLGVGGAGGARMGMRHAGLERQMTSDLLNPEQVPLGDLRETAEWKQAFMNKAGENGNDWYDELMRDQFALRNQQIKDDMFNQALDTMHGDVDRSILALPAPVREMPSTMPELDALAENERGATDAVRRNEELWAQREAEARQRPGLDGFTRLPAPGQSSYVMPAEGSTAQVDLMRLGELGARTDATTRAENANALLADAQSNRPVTDGWSFNTQRISIPQDLGSAIGVLNQAVEMRRANQPIVSGSEMHSALLAADSIVRQSGYDPKQIVRHYEGTPSATQTQPVAAQAAATTQQKAQPKPAAAPAANVTQPRGKFSQAFQARLEVAVAEGKVAPDDPIVADWHASKKLKADAQSFGLRLNEIEAGPDNMPLTAEQSLQAKAKNAVAEVKAGGLNLTMKQIPVFEHLQKAFAENRIDDVLGADGKWKYNEIGNALGIERGKVMSRVDGVAKAIAAKQNVSVDEMKAALKARTAEVRTTEMSEKDKLGLSPKQQSSVFNEEDLFGNENGAEQNAGVINTVGGSQGEVGNNEDLALLPERSFSDSDTATKAAKALAAKRFEAEESARLMQRRRDAEAAFANAVNDLQEALDNPHLEESLSTWDELSEEVKGGAPNRVEIEPMILLEWVDTYSNIVDNHEGKFEELWGKLQDAHAELIQDSENFNGRTRTENEADRGLPGVQGGQKQIGVSRGEVREVQEGQPVAEQAAGRSDTEGQAGEVTSGKVLDMTSRLEQREDEETANEVEAHYAAVRRQTAEKIATWFADNMRVLGKARNVLEVTGARLPAVTSTEIDLANALRDVDSLWVRLQAYMNEGTPIPQSFTDESIRTDALNLAKKFLADVQTELGKLNKANKVDRALIAEIKPLLDAGVKAFPKSTPAPKKSYAKTQAEDVAVIDEADKYVTYLGELIAGDMTHRTELENLLLDKTKGRVIINLIATAKREFPTVLKGVKGHGDLIKFVQAREEAVGGDKRQRKNRLSTLTESVEDGEVKDVLDAIVENYAAEGRASMLDNVRDIGVHDKAHDEINYNHEDGTYSILIGQASIKNGRNHILMGVEHEVAHALDDFFVGPQYSDTPMMGVLVAQSRKMYADYANGNKDNVLGEIMQYPFTDNYDSQRTRQEVFAQLMSIYSVESLRAELKKQSPVAYNFIKGVHDAEKAKQAGNTAAKVQRKDNGPDQSGDGQRFRKITAERIQEVAGPTAARLSTDASTIIGRAAKWFMSLHDLIGKYGNMLPSANDWYKSVRATIATRTQLEGDAESIAARAGKLKPKALEALNKFVADSTFEQKWGFNATFDKIDGTKRSVTADPEMARRFNALPEDARQIAKDMFLHAEAVKLTKYKLLKELGLSGLFDTQGSLAGPYAPLKRFGNYVAVLKSKELLAAEKADDKKLVEELKRDYKHYVVSYFDTKGLAKEFAENEKAKDGWAYAQHFPKAQHIKETSETSQATLQKVLAAMKVEKDKLPPGAYAMIEEVILDMHMRKFDEDNARMNGLKRKNRYGYDEDMVRAFLSHARAEAGFLANLKHGGTTNELFYKMQFEAGKAKDRDAAMEVFNAISNHYAANIDQRETPIQDRITALTSVMQLATNPAYHLQNLTQPFITSVPRLAADFGDYAGAWKALMEGYRVVRSVGTKNIDLSKVQNLKLRAALQGASDAGLLDVGMDEDLINFEATRTGYAALDVASKGAKKVIHMLRQVSRRVEGANRISAAVAAFNMAQASGKFKDDAAINDYVISVLQDTQGDFSRTDAPLIIKKLPKPLVQYRKFQLMMAAHYVKAFNDAFRSESPEARAVGRRALAYSLGHAFATAGALGIPLMNIVGLIFAHTGDDDEPRDLERSLREWIGDEGMAKLLLHGPLWWMGMDAKLAQDKVFSFLPYADWDLTSKEGVKNLMWGMTGPAGSQALKMVGGLEYLSKGDTIKGFEGLLPSGISNGLKAFRVANEGFTLKNGDLMMKPEEINGAALMFDAVGLKSPTMRDLEWTRNQQYEIKEFYQTKTKEIQRAYADAYKDGDTEAMTEAREEWMALQEGKDRLRAVFNNSPDELKRQPLSTLLKYPRTQDKREQKLQKSVPE